MKSVKALLPKSIKIKWKLTFWAALLILFLFLSYTFVQYVVIMKWVNNHERQTIQKNMEEIYAYLLEADSEQEILESKAYIDILNEHHQLIRIVSENNSVLFTITNKVPKNWVSSQSALKEELVEMSPKGDRLLVYRKPFEVTGFKGTIEIVRNLENFESLINQITTLVIITGLVAIILSFVGGRILSFQLLKPINSMIRTMKSIKENGLNKRVNIDKQHDEMTELGIMFNELMDNLETSFQQQQQFVEDASHELKTPLTIIHGHLSLINRWGKDNPQTLERSLNLSLNETNRLIRMVSELLTLSRGDFSTSPAVLEDIKIKGVIEDVVENFLTLNPDYNISSSIDISKDFTLKIFKNHLEQIIIILLDNAIKYSKNKKEIELKVKHSENSLAIEIKDYGVGIPEEDLPLVINRFYRVDKARSRKNGGNGLGLAIAKRLLEYYKGSIEIQSVYGEWTKVIINIPLSKDSDVLFRKK